MAEHQQKYHRGYKCLMCAEKFNNKKNLLQHKKMHDKELNVSKLNDSILSSYPVNVYSSKCNPCQESFRTSEDLMSHLSEKHIRKEQRKGDGPAKYKNDHDVRENDDRKPACTNGDYCRFHRQSRCDFYHPLPPKFLKSRPQRKTPSNEWQQVPARWQSNHQGYNSQQPFDHSSQGPWVWGASRDISNTWCKHPHNCLQGRFCVMRQNYEQDFPTWTAHSRN